MVDDFVFAVDLKNKCIVNLVLAENLDVACCCHNDKHQNECKDICFNARVQFLPSVLLSTHLRESQEENEENQQDKCRSYEQGHDCGISSPYFVVLRVQDLARFLFTAFLEHVRIKDQNTVSKHFEIFAAFACIFFDELFRLNYIDQL